MTKSKHVSKRKLEDHCLTFIHCQLDNSDTDCHFIGLLTDEIQLCSCYLITCFLKQMLKKVVIFPCPVSGGVAVHV